MNNRIHIFGASGSGTTTLGKVLSETIDIPLFDADDYYWVKTEPPFQIKRSKELRQIILKEDVSSCKSWILSGSMMDWGDFLIPKITLAIYLYLPQNIRLERLIKREKERYGSRIEIGNDMYQQHIDFIKWAKKYDTGSSDMRSKKSHLEWMKKLKCPLIKIEADVDIKEKIETILIEIKKSNI